MALVLRRKENTFECRAPCMSSLPLLQTISVVCPSNPCPLRLIQLFFFPSPTGRLGEYLGSMAKIQKAVEYFQDNSPDSPELNKVVRNLWISVRQTDGHHSLIRSHEGHVTV